MRALALALALAALASGAASPDRYEIAEESRLWIDGSATTGDWSCEADDVSGTGVLGSAPEAEVSIPVRDLDCGFGPMNRDLYHALDADAHPAISFTLARADHPRASPDADWIPVRALGHLDLAGTRRTVSVAAEVRRLPDGRVAARGQHALRMTDFGVTPPSHALGLVRAHDDITVRFDLIATAL